MQLEKKAQPNIKAALTMATCALLGTSSDAASDENQWDLDTAVLYYGETDRVTAVEGVISANKEFDDEHFLNLKLTLDTLTGASANGAVAQPQVQTFTRPSGEGQYQAQAGETPLDDTFKDTRLQLNAQWTQPLARNYTASGGMHVSKEYDYLSLGLNSNLAVDFNKKNTTVAAGFSYFYDSFSPEGGIPRALTQMLIGDSSEPNWEQAFADTRLTKRDDKTTTDILFGITQVINRRMISQFNYSYSQVSGYLTDPFKVLSVVNDQGLTQALIYENRPDNRVKQSLFSQAKYHFEHSILDISYRYMWDDWHIKSHTLDTRYRVMLNGQNYIEPHVRYYQQSAAAFYHPYLMQSSNLPDFASADYRIGEMSALTLGFKYGTVLANNEELSVRLEYYQQTPSNAGFLQPGVLADMQLYQGVDAVVVQVSYSF